MYLKAFVLVISLVLAAGNAFAAAPVVTLAQDTLNFTDVESDSYHLVTVGATVTDADGGVNGDAELAICADGGARGGSNGVILDDLYINTDGTGLTIELNPANIKEDILLYNGTKIGELAAGNGLAPLVLFFSRDATMAEVNHILQNIMWRNRSNTPRTSRVFAISLFDGVETSNFANLTINVTNANEPPVNRTDQYAPEANPLTIRNTYFGVDYWHLLRGPSEEFVSEVFDGATSYKLVIDDNPQVGSHQGYVYTAENATHVSVDLFVPSDWGVTGGAAPSLWIESLTNDGERVEDTYPIMRVQQKAGESHPAYFQCYINDDWYTQNLPADVQLDTWMTMDVRIVSGDVLFKLSGMKTDGTPFELTATQTGTRAVALWNVALQPATAAAGESYTCYYRNDVFNTGNPDTNDIWKSLDVIEGRSNAIEGLEVADPDPGDTLTTTFTSTAGKFSVTSQLGAVVTGNGTSMMEVSGTVDQINETLKTLFFISTYGVTGSQAITVTTMDVGGLSDTDTINLAVTPLGDAYNIPALNEWGIILSVLLFGVLISLRITARKRSDKGLA